MLGVILSTLIQVFAAVLLALVVWLFRKARSTGFRDYVGLIPCSPRPLVIGILVAAIGATGFLLIPGVAEAVTGPGTVAGDAAGGSQAQLIPTLLLLAVVKTSFAEELVFRGIVAKRFIEWWGFTAGNIAQAVVFALVHIFVFFDDSTGLLLDLMFIVFALALGWFAGWLNELRGSGSIMPGWLAHATANSISYLGATYVV